MKHIFYPIYNKGAQLSRYSDGLRAGRPGFDSREGIIDFFDSVQTDSRAHPASYSMGTEEYFTGVKWPGLEADHSPSSRAEVKNGGAVSPLKNTSLCRPA
jgi:hypothetical protein